MIRRSFEDHNLDPAITLTCAMDLITEQRARSFIDGDHLAYDAWIWAGVATEVRRDWYRLYNAENCEPWFDGSAFSQPSERAS